MLRSISSSLAFDNTDDSANDLFKLANKLQFAYPDSSTKLLNLALGLALENKDTLSAVKILELDTEVNGHLGRYYKSYSDLTQKIKLAKEANFQEDLILSYIKLGRLYGYLKRKKKALLYINLAQDLIQQNIENKISDQSELIYPYFAKTGLHREFEEFDIAEIYLDSCYLISDSFISRNFHMSLPAEKAAILISKKDYQSAILILNELIPVAEKASPNFLIIIHKNLGDAYAGKKNFNQSIEEYKKAIALTIELNKHLDYSVLIYHKLSNVYKAIGDYESALATFKEGEEIDFRIFDSRSENNSNLFEVQDQLLKFKEEQKRIEQEGRLLKLQNEEKLFRLQRWSLIGGIFLISLIGFLATKSQKQKKESQRRRNIELLDKMKIEAEYTAKIEEKNNQFLAFSSIMTHDLKSPLRTIHSFSSLLMRKAEKENFGPDITEKIGFISTSATRMSELIDDLLVYSQIEIDSLKLEPIQLNQLMTNLLATFQYDIENNSAEIKIDSLPEIIGDKAIVKMVFQNIISNGLKYQPQNDTKHIPQISLWSESHIDHHNIFIKDNGIGISKDYVDHVFTPFNRYHAASEYEGTGLGLSICKRIMNKHNGDILLHSSSNEGSVFNIRFPKQIQKDV